MHLNKIYYRGERGWYRDLPRNAITKTEYRGVNSLLPPLLRKERGYSETDGYFLIRLQIKIKIPP